MVIFRQMPKPAWRWLLRIANEPNSDPPAGGVARGASQLDAEGFAGTRPAG
jgi:hypothetical protein